MDKIDNKKVFVGLSGGVDSSVAAHLLKEEGLSAGRQGYDVVGIHLRCWNRDGCDEKEAEDARRVADKLGIKFYVLNLEKEYKERVVDYMIDGYKKGITPNPDVMCNREIKFGLFMEKALEMGADYVATGHYVSLKRDGDIYELYEGKDGNKDQSYFLWTLTQKQLAKSLFPIGDYTKEEVRKIAHKINLPNADKKDSQGICFIGQVSIKEFLEEYLPKKRGNARTTDGKILGTHEGAHFYTIGQRHGLGLGGGTPYFVSEKDMETNTVILATRDEPELYKKEINIADINLISGTDNIPEEVLVRVRYRQPLQKAKISFNKDGAKIVFNKPQEFVAAGQSAVFYDGKGKMLGGGIIV